MSWDNGKAEEAAMVDFLETALQPPAPQPFVVTRQMRHEVVGEIQQHVHSHVPVEFAWIVKMALLDYGCRSLINEPDEEEDDSAQAK
jgi:hypothetical protein